jgi:lysophospholipase L1-like esterase
MKLLPTLVAASCLAIGYQSTALAAAATVVSVDTANVNYVIPYSGTPTWTRVFIDANKTATSGFVTNGIGADYLIENGNLFRYSGSNGSWAWTKVKAVGFTRGSGSATVNVAKTDIGSPTAIDSVTQTDPPVNYSAKITTTIAPATAPAPSGSSTATVDALNINYVIPFASTPTWTRIYIDADRTAASGYPNGGIGADYFVENGGLFRYSGSNGSWSWTRIKSVPFTVGATSASVSVAKADIGAPPSIDSITQTDAPTKISPKFTTSTTTGTTPAPAPTPTPTPTPTPVPPPSTTTVYVDYFGDSTAHGDIGATPYQVARQPSVVMDQNLPANYVVRNEAVGGASVKELLAGTDGVHAPWTTTVAKSNASYVIMNYSINDSYEVGTTVATYKDSYRKVIDIARAAGKTVILQTTNPTLNNQKDVAFSTAMKEVAAEKNVAVIDVFTYISQYMATNHLGPYQITNDGIHPNQDIYIMVGEYSAKRFREIVGIK